MSRSAAGTPPGRSHPSGRVGFHSRSITGARFPTFRCPRTAKLEWQSQLEVARQERLAPFSCRFLNAHSNCASSFVVSPSAISRIRPRAERPGKSRGRHRRRGNGRASGRHTPIPVTDRKRMGLSRRDEPQIRSAQNPRDNPRKPTARRAAHPRRAGRPFSDANYKCINGVCVYKPSIYLKSEQFRMRIYYQSSVINIHKFRFIGVLCLLSSMCGRSPDVDQLGQGQG